MGTYSRNIYINYLFVGLTSFDVTHGFWMIFLASRGFSLIQLGILESIFHIVSLLVEIPTGAIADIWGRRRCRIFGRIMAFFGILLMFISHTFILQIVAFIATALGYNFESGSGEALIYDSLLYDSLESRFMIITGKQEMIYQSVSILSFIVGGLLATTSYSLLFGTSLLGASFAILVSLLFSEPQKSSSHNIDAQNPQRRTRVLHALVHQFTQSLHTLKKERKIGFFILFSELIFSFKMVLFYYQQNYWTSIGWKEFHIGIVFSLYALISGITALKAHSIERLLKEKGVITYMPILMLISLWGIALSDVGYIFFMFTGIVEGVLIVSVASYINVLIPSESRATILSVQSMVFSLCMMAVFPVFGYIGHNWSIRTAFLSIAIVATLVWIPYMIYIRPFRHTS